MEVFEEFCDFSQRPSIFLGSCIAIPVFFKGPNISCECHRRHICGIDNFDFWVRSGTVVFLGVHRGPGAHAAHAATVFVRVARAISGAPMVQTLLTGTSGGPHA